MTRWKGATSTGWIVALLGCAAAVTAETGRVPWPSAAVAANPKEFGTQDQTITVISAASFGCGLDSTLSCWLGPLSRTFDLYARLELPAGAVIDTIGVNNQTDTNAVMGFALYERDRYANLSLLYGYSFPPHDWDTDFSDPLGILVPDHLDKELVLNVEWAPSPTLEAFAWVEVHWHRTVSPPPPAPSFGDVPTTDFGYQYVEALKASGITGGCGDGTVFCPDANLTRRQMAIFLAKALGLHWPN